MTGTAVTQQKKTWLDILKENENKFAMALPNVGLTSERVIRTALTAMQQSKNGILLKCDPKSVIASIIQACEVGLSVSNTLGHAYLVPFRNNEKGIVECTLIIGYRGYIALMKRSKEVSDIKATIVYDKELFDMGAGDRPFLKHTPLAPEMRGSSIVGAYATVLFTDGNATFEWMWYDDIMKIKSRSKAKESGPWVTDTEEMIKKCPIRRIAKRMPMSAELQKAAVIDEYNESGIRVTDIFIPEEDEKPLEESVKPKSEPLIQEDQSKESSPTITSKQASMISILCNNIGIKDDAMKHAVIGIDILKRDTPVSSVKDLTGKEAITVIKWLQQKESEIGLPDANNG